MKDNLFNLLKKRLFLFWACVLLCVFPCHAGGEIYDVWDGTSMTAITPIGDVYTVNSAAELRWVAQQNNVESGFAGKTIRLGANIDLAGYSWQPIGSATVPFAGTFEGQHHLIRGLRLFTGSDGVGLFGYIGASGHVSNIGISGGNIIADSQRRVGALAGVCLGNISSCWSSAEISVSGYVTGGLVGEMMSGSHLTNAYCSGLVLHASDTMGVLAGRNAGTITRAYTTGYAKNGYGFVGIDNGGSYSDCYYDRKLYYQEQGFVNSGITPKDATREMFSIMTGKAGWVTTADKYPQLSGFETTDASLLSVAPIFLDTVADNPSSLATVHHANNLLGNFGIYTAGHTITWATQRPADVQWIDFVNDEDTAYVTRPCSETDVLATLSLGNENKVMYFRLERIEDFKVGIFGNKKSYSKNTSTLCFDAEINLKDSAVMSLAQKGWTNHYYTVVQYGFDSNNDTIVLDTLLNDVLRNDYSTWYNSYQVPTDSAGRFFLRSFVHDDGCVLDLLPNNGRFAYTVLPKFVPGTIPTAHDTLYLAAGSATTDILSFAAASGGNGKINYVWNVNEVATDSTSEDLSGWRFTKKGTYVFTRTDRDSLCAEELADGADTIVVFDEFKAGKVNPVSSKNFEKVFCTVEDAEAYTATATAATGGSETYHYRWYTLSGSTLTEISGATEQNLSLSLLHPTAGTTYTLVRKAEDDTRFTSLTRSGDSLVVRIGLPFNKGSITNRTDTLYLNKGAVKVTVASTAAATGGDGNISYRWTVNGAAVTDANQPSLTDYSITTAGTYTFTRTDRDSLCHSEQADGKYTVVVFDAFVAGAVNDAGEQTFCTVQDAQAFVVNGTNATGGSGKYQYQWYTLSGSTLTAIPSATSRDLPLADVTLTAGNDYTFIRKDKDDTRFTSLTQASGRQTIHILPVLDAGAIENVDKGHVCIEHDATTVLVRINETQPASGAGTLQYRWLRLNGSETMEVGTGAVLSYVALLSEFETDVVYTYVREVQYADCGWLRSSGQVTMSFGQKLYGERALTACIAQKPFVFTWYDSRGNAFSHTFTNEGEQHTFTDEYAAGGCPADTVYTIHFVDIPFIHLDAEANLCQTTGTISLNFETASGTPDVFHITYSPDLAKYMGRIDTTGIINIPGTIVIKNVPMIGVGDCYLHVEVGNSGGDMLNAANVCYSSVATVQMHVTLGGYVHSKYDRVLFVDNNPNNDELPSPKLHFTAYQWYKNGVKQEGQTGQYYHEDGNALNGVYYAMLTADDGNTYQSCDIIMPEENTYATSQSIVYPTIVSAGDRLHIQCLNAKVSLYNATGDCMMTLTMQEQQTINAPKQAGVYYIRIVDNEGGSYTEKIIVR